MKIPKRIYIAATLLVFLGGAGTALALKPEEAPLNKIEVQQVATVKPVEQPTTQVETPPVTQQAVTQPQAQDEPAPVVTNPYPEGFNIWHAFNRRSATGMTTPDGPKSDSTYCQIVYGGSASENYGTPTFSATPSVHAIVCAKRAGGPSVTGFLESINGDGSLTISCTNCGSGWNTPMELNIPASETNKYIYLQ